MLLTFSLTFFRFRVKYHPIDSQQRKDEHQASIERRLEVFQQLTNRGWIERSRLDVDNGRNILKLLDGGKTKNFGQTIGQFYEFSAKKVVIRSVSQKLGC